MTVKKLTDAQKDAIVTIFTSNVKPKNITEIAGFLNVSTRTVRRVLDEKGVTSPKEARNLEAVHIMTLMYKHKVTVQVLEQLLEDFSTGQLQYTSGFPIEYQTKRTKKSPKAHNGKQTLLPLNLPPSLELH